MQKLLKSKSMTTNLREMIKMPKEFLRQRKKLRYRANQKKYMIKRDHHHQIMERQISRRLMALRAIISEAHMAKTISCHSKSLEVEVLVTSTWSETKTPVSSTP